MTKGKVKILYIFKDGHHNRRLFKDGDGPDTSLMGYNHLGQFNIDADYLDMDYKLNGRSSWQKIYYDLINILKDLEAVFRSKNYDAVFLTHSLKIVFLAKSLFHLNKTKIFFYNINLRSILRNTKKNKIKYWLVRRAINKIDAIICPSQSQIEFLISEGFDSGRLHFIPTGVDLDFISKNKVNIESMAEKNILSVGHDRGRDYRTLIEAVRGLPIKVRIIAKHSNIPGDLMIPENVTVESLPYKELLKLYCNCLFVVVPTIDENETVYQSDCSGHTVILDAMACGKAVIATQRSTITHLIEPGKNGLLAEPKNSEDLRKKIQALVDNEALCREMGELSQKKVNQFSTRNFAGQLGALIESMFK